MRQNPLEALRKNPFVLAPMAGITDYVFRGFMRKLDSSVVVSELVSATGIEYESQRTFELMNFDESQRPVAIQLFGEDPDIVARAAQVVEDKGADFVDLNFGCPVPKVVKKGAGSAMLKDPVALQKMLSTVVKAVKIPVTIKIRTGWDSTSRNAAEVCNIAYNEGITWVGIHGRTRAQGYEGLADWEFISEVKSQVKIPILGNGDILTPEAAVSRLRESGCDGVLIGRGALKNPFIFADALSLWRGEDRRNDLKRKLSEVYCDLSQAFVKNCSEHIANIQLKKFASWFSTGYPGAAAFRKQLFQLKSNDEVLCLAIDYFENLEIIERTHQSPNFREDQSKEAFLMGGHG